MQKKNPISLCGRQRRICYRGSRSGCSQTIVTWHNRTIWSTTPCTQSKSSFPVIGLLYICLFTQLIRDSRSLFSTDPRYIYSVIDSSCSLPNFPVEPIHCHNTGSHTQGRRQTVILRDNFITLFLRRNIKQKTQAWMPWYFLLFYHF